MPGTCHSNLKTSKLTYAVEPTNSASYSSYPWPMTTRSGIKRNIVVQGYPVWGYNDGSVDTGSSGLSTGAKAGIGVGVAVGALIIIGLLVFWFLWRRNKKKQAEAEAAGAVAPVEVDTGVVAASELESKHNSAFPVEADSHAGEVAELDKKPDTVPMGAAELQTRDDRAEVEGTTGSPPMELESPGFRFELEGSAPVQAQNEAEPRRSLETK